MMDEKEFGLTAKAINALNEALNHQLANRGTENEFYRCYTYSSGIEPNWIKLAKDVLGEKSKRKVTYK
jgi:hypothetical protein